MSRWDNTEITAWQAVENISEYLDNKATEIYNKYKNYMDASIEDIRSELTIIAYDKFEQWKGTSRNVTANNSKSFAYNLSIEINKNINNLLSGYIYSTLSSAETTSIVEKAHEIEDTDFTKADTIRRLKWTVEEADRQIIFNNLISKALPLEEAEDNELCSYTLGEEVFRFDMVNLLKESLEVLNRRDMKALTMLMGLDNSRQHTYDEIAEELWVSRYKAYYICAKALCKLRKLQRTKRLIDYVK